mmetsp:Transcript_13532/g.33773  ORF Transcript_13532/g.33773 Transcript_13532/m.33773 type:complete len:101 (-) Transcript_13532:23-325(-)
MHLPDAVRSSIPRNPHDNPPINVSHQQSSLHEHTSSRSLSSDVQRDLDLRLRQSLDGDHLLSSIGQAVGRSSGGCCTSGAILGRPTLLILQASVKSRKHP